METEDPKRTLQQQEADSMRRVAFVGISVSTAAIITAIIVVPMLYSYMHRVQSTLDVELDYCQLRTGNLMNEFEKIQTLKGVNERLKRATGIYRGERRYLEESVKAARAKARAAQIRSDGTLSVAEPEPTEVPPALREEEIGEDQCCSCNVGQAGPAGPSGIDGRPGNFYEVVRDIIER
ncbi:Cuticle collagen 12 [Toxocara canis]|uniref:Cuticle collagen 12 n=1 Tax=Toxocara canis TaxID=6265 RepID=A0A0B2VFI7_TOXCA|nr:Cuticle collagen 12 [Toxocara canis]